MSQSEGVRDGQGDEAIGIGLSSEACKRHVQWLAHDWGAGREAWVDTGPGGLPALFLPPGLSQLSFVVAIKWAKISFAYPRKKSDTFGELMEGWQ